MTNEQLQRGLVTLIDIVRNVIMSNERHQTGGELIEIDKLFKEMNEARENFMVQQQNIPKLPDKCPNCDTDLIRLTLNIPRGSSIKCNRCGTKILFLND